jgi:hypothetical protein
MSAHVFSEQKKKEGRKEGRKEEKKIDTIS